MGNMRRREFFTLLGCAAVSRIARAESYPSRPVRLIVPFGSAGATDIVARLIGQYLSERLGQTFIIENRPGAGQDERISVGGRAHDRFDAKIAAGAGPVLNDEGLA